MAFGALGMFPTVLSFSIIFSSCILQIAADTWIYPLPNTNAVFNRTDSLNVTWATTFTSPYIILWCQTSGASTFTKEFNISVSGAGSYVIDLSKYGNQPLGCHLEVAEAGTGLPSLTSPDFHINDLQSSPPTTWRLSDPSIPTSASPTSFTAATSSIPAGGTVSTAPTLAITTPKSPSSLTKPTAQAAASSAAPPQKTGASDGLSVGAAVGISLGILIVVITLLGTFWYVRRSNRMSDAADQARELAAINGAEFKSSRATSEVDPMQMRPERLGYPVGVGGTQPPPTAEALEGRPYWGRPF